MATKSRKDRPKRDDPKAARWLFERESERVRDAIGSGQAILEPICDDGGPVRVQGVTLPEWKTRRLPEGWGKAVNACNRLAHDLERRFCFLNNCVNYFSLPTAKEYAKWLQDYSRAWNVANGQHRLCEALGCGRRFAVLDERGRESRYCSKRCARAGERADERTCKVETPSIGAPPSVEDHDNPEAVAIMNEEKQRLLRCAVTAGLLDDPKLLDLAAGYAKKAGYRPR